MCDITGIDGMTLYDARPYSSVAMNIIGQWLPLIETDNKYVQTKICTRMKM